MQAKHAVVLTIDEMGDGRGGGETVKTAIAFTSVCIDKPLIIHGLLNIWTELLYLPCPHEADLLILIMSHKLTQCLYNFKKIPF